MTDTVQTIDDLDDDLGVERFVFDDADWKFYELILKRVGDRHIFVTYDGERLEVMSPSPEHERHASRLEKIIWLLTLELRMPCESMGSFTLKQRKANRGLEPDRCFYTRNSAAVIGKRRIDLSKDPPPDLAIEIEVSRRLLDRIDVYRRLRVPEVWCYDGQRLRVLRLGKGRGAGYQEVSRSPTFPDLPPEEIHRLLELGWGKADLEWTDAVRASIGKHVPPRKGV
jgi:Uma2 family endonuclease